MSDWIIDSYSNSGYPCLSDVSCNYTETETPYPLKCFIISENLSEGYPYISKIFAKSLKVKEPYPLKSFIINNQFNDGYPYLNFLYTISYCEKVKQNNKIIVYDMHETDFSHFGKRILSPVSCKITEEYNGMYELEMQHIVDEEGTWQQINELDIIKAKGQLFRIYRIIRRMNSDGSKYVEINARHIFYDLNDRLVLDARPTNLNGKQAIDWILTHTYKHQYDIFKDYEYQCYSDIESINTAYYQDMTPVEALIGADNCFLNRWGGELYRDNFYFSINQRRENSQDNAFNILYSLNMFEIEETIDYSDFCSFLLAESNVGSSYHISYAYHENALPHNFYKKVKFTYDEYDFETFCHDVELYFSTVSVPSVSYTVKFADLSDTEMYKDFVDLQRCEVGDKGVIKNEKLNISTVQMVVKKVYDVVNNRTESIELGNIKTSFTGQRRFSNTISDGNSINDKLQSELYDLKLKTLSTHINIANYTHEELEKFTNKELGGEKL